MYGTHFYNESTRRYVAVFGTMFNNLQIERKSGSTSVQKMKVPINYAPMQKILARLEQDPNLDAPAITLPRMSFEITGMNYSSERKLTSMTTQVKGSPTSDGRVSTMFAPAPYDIEFQLNIMTKYNEDGMKILEQILPYFKPDCTVSVKMIDELNTYVDIPVVLTGVSQEDTYEADFQTRRALIWTLNFTMKAFFFGPTSPKKQIKFVDVDLYPDLPPTTSSGEQLDVTPSVPQALSGLTPSTSYRIYDLGDTTGGITPVTRWNTYLSTSGQTYKVGDIFTAPASPATNAPAGATATPVPANINENDSWQAMTIITDIENT